MKNLKLLVAILVFMFSGLVSAQTDVSLPNFEDLTVGQEIVITVSTSAAINDIYSLSIFIGYDENVLDYVGIENNPFSGNFLLGDNTGELSISWFSLSPAAVTDKLFDLKFTYLGGSTDLEFVKTNQITDLSTPLNINFVNGGIIDNTVPPAKEVEVQSPNGGESWEKGSTQTISWTDNFDENVKIELWKAEAYLEDIVASTASDGSYAWTLQHSLAEASDYKVKIISVDSSNVFDMSNAPFTVAPAPPLFITVTSPNGGESWGQTTTQNITWNDNIDGNVKIELFKGLIYNSDIVASTESDGSYSWTIPSDLAVGADYSVKITSLDSTEINDESNAQFSVIEFNNPPVVSDIPDQTITAGESFTTINLDDYVSDLDDADADITWTYSGNSDLIVQISNRVATITTPNASWTGEETITFTAKDPSNDSDSDPAKFKVNSSFNPEKASITISQVSGIAGSDVIIPVLSDSLGEVGSLTMFITFDPNVLEYIAIENNPFTGNFLANDNGGELAISWFSLTPVQVTDKLFDLKFNYKGGSAEIGFTGTNQITDMSTALDVNFVKGGISELVAPVISEIPNQTVLEGESFSTIALDDYVEDANTPDADLVWTISGQTELIPSIDENRIVTIEIPSTEWNGSETLLFVVSDPEGGKDSAEVVFTVTADNDKPIIGSIGNRTINEGETFEDILLDDFVEDVDNEDEEITWTVENNSELVFSIEERVLKVTIPNEDWFGVDTVNLIAADPSELKDTATVIFTVENVNDLPEIAEIPDTMLYNNGAPIELDLWSYVSDVDDEVSSLDFNFIVSNDSLEILYDDASGYITISANASYLGVVEVTVEVADASEEKVTNTFSVTVDTDTDVFDEDVIPNEYTLYQNYPNPFNPTTKVSFGLPQNTNVKIEVFDILGNLVTKLVDAPMSAGNHTVQFNAVNLTSGTYFYRIETSNFGEVKKMLLLK